MSDEQPTTNTTTDSATEEVAKEDGPSKIRFVFDSNVEKPEALVNNENINSMTAAVVSPDQFRANDDDEFRESGISQLTPFDAYKYEQVQQQHQKQPQQANDVEITMDNNGTMNVNAADIGTSTYTQDTASTGGHSVPLKRVSCTPKEFESSLVSRPSTDATTKLNNKNIPFIENKNIKPLNIKEDLVRIFLSDDSDEYMEVTEEQLDRTIKMHKQIEENAMFTFNYNTLILCAAIIAGLGLVSNSSTTIIASMLVSPLMGTVVGMAYGRTVQYMIIC